MCTSVGWDAICNKKKRNHELEKKLAWERLKVKKGEGRNDAILF